MVATLRIQEYYRCIVGPVALDFRSRLLTTYTWGFQRVTTLPRWNTGLILGSCTISTFSSGQTNKHFPELTASDAINFIW